MISKIASILTVGVATLVLAAAPAQALTNQQKASIAALKKQLQKQPLHKGNVGKINQLVKQLVTKDPKNAASYLNLGLTKLPMVNAKANAKKLTNTVNTLVKKAKTLKPNQKNSIVKKNNNLLKKYVPPGPNNPPYQAMVLGDVQAAA